MKTINASEARQTLPSLLDKVAGGEEIPITRHGEVVAVLVHPDALQRRRNPDLWRKADQIEEDLAAAGQGSTAAPALSMERAEELVRSIDAGRNR